MVAIGMGLRALTPHGTVTYMFYNGAEKTVVLGSNGLQKNRADIQYTDNCTYAFTTISKVLTK